MGFKKLSVDGRATDGQKRLLGTSLTIGDGMK